MTCAAEVRAALRVPAAAIALTLLIGVCSGCHSRAGVSTGDVAADFVLPGLDGSIRKLSNYRGRVVLVNLWATWCPPCVAEMPLLNLIEREWGPRGVVVLGVAADEDPVAVRRFVRSSKLAFEVLLDPAGAVGTQYGITGYPETFVVDREGVVVAKFIGPLPSSGDQPGPALVEAMRIALDG